MKESSGNQEEQSPLSHHAPPARLHPALLQPTMDDIEADPTVQAMLEGFPEMAILLNEHRQIVAYNRASHKLVDHKKRDSLFGRRFGEVIGCIHSSEMPAGCGTSETCKTCGAINTVLASQISQKPKKQECRISIGTPDQPGSLELEVVATPFLLNGQNLLLFAARDISADKRRESLERLFFHDTMNVAGGILGLAEMMGQEDEFDHDICPQRLRLLSRQLVEQIQGQRDLAAAEKGELQPTWATLEMRAVFQDLQATYEAHPVAEERTLQFNLDSAHDLIFQSDRALLNRVLGNLIKNALEASEPGQQVTVTGGQTSDGQICFTVHNETVMPRAIQLQVFKRSFSTKGGKGRGLGTFSVKLLAGKYLRGQVEFHSEIGKGTTFSVTIPRSQNPDWIPAPAGQVILPEKHSLAGCRILLAEDSPENQHLITHFLKQAEAEVTVCENGKIALDTALEANANNHPFEVILMDMQMPVMDGFEATILLRQNGYAGLVIALTAHSSEQDRQQCLHTGCQDFLTKPVSREVLISTLHKLLNQTSLSRDEDKAA